MTSKPFTLTEHLEPMCRWLYLRNAFIPSKSEIPKAGIVVSKGNDMVAMGFLRLMEGNHALWDGLVTNPDISPEVRHDALDQVFSELIEKAKELEIKTVIGWTVDDNTYKRALSHGFKPSSFAGIVTLNLTPPGDL